MAVFGFVVLCVFGVVVSFWFLAALSLKGAMGASSDTSESILYWVIFIVLCVYWRWLFSIAPFTVTAT